MRTRVGPMVVVSVATLILTTPAWLVHAEKQKPIYFGSVRSHRLHDAPRIDRVRTVPARLADLRPEPRGPVPTRLRIPAIAVDAPVIRVGVSAGTTEIPSDVATIGWYRFGAAPGEHGSSVLLGHVDSGAQGPGAFFHLVDLGPGDEIEVLMTDGTVPRFVVDARRQYAKSDLPDWIFRRSGPATLTLVTCGGTFDWSTGHYADNVVVFAAPADG
jgi:sortase (surface protein transpeptidase)